MKQVIQDLSNGETYLIEVPAPMPTEGTVIIKSASSLVSSGTERTLLNFGKSNYLQKALQQPDKVKAALDKVKTDGFFSTYEAVTSKLSQPIGVGYCNAGTIVDSNIEDFFVGDRVVSNGPHAELVRSTENLCVKLPDSVDFEEAPFAVIGSIGLQAIRLLNPTLGETIVVSGLGLVGLITIQILKANGMRVIGIDVDKKRCDLARSYGAEVIDLSLKQDPVQFCNDFTNNIGVDGVIIAATSKSDEVIHQAAEMCRKKGRIILIGVVGMNLRREDFYEKELTFQVSSSYGPGRYDPSYEEKGIDYPISQVRWTAKRNIEAVLELMSKNKIEVRSLISNKFKIEEIKEAYSALYDPSSLGILISYSDQKQEELSKRTYKIKENLDQNPSEPTLGFIGSGNYASRILIPAFQRYSRKLEMVVTSTGLSSYFIGKRSSISKISTDLDDLLSNREINTVVIATRHNLHAQQTIASLKAGKNVFVEKPLALNIEELDELKAVYIEENKSRKEPLKVLVGFNRRFSPLIKIMKDLLEKNPAPSSINMMINAGKIDKDHWTQNPDIGGGRIIGEVCHFLDLISFLSNSPIKSYEVKTFTGESKQTINDNILILLSFKNGGFGSIHYVSNGGSSFPKERVEVFSRGSTLQLDNYKVLNGYNWPSFKKKSLFRQDKGQNHCVEEFLNSIKNGDESPIPIDDIFNVSALAIEISNSLLKNP